MGKSLLEYLDLLSNRSDLIWPRPPQPAPMKATPFTKPLPGIKLVTWEVYGTLLSIDRGRLLHAHPEELRMQIALDKTIHEFHMWYSMSRKPGQPWEYMLRQYMAVLEELKMAGTKRKGDIPEVNSARVWYKLLDRLQRNEYTYDEDLYGDLDDLAVKVAYFFHANLQGVAAAAHARETLMRLSSAGIRQGLLADGQPFTIAQLLMSLRQQGQVLSINELLTSSFVTVSHQIGFRKPSPTLFERAAEVCSTADIHPEEVLHVSHRLKDDLAMARRVGFRTALFAADANTCSITKEDVRDPKLKPDRLITDVRQVAEIVGQ